MRVEWLMPFLARPKLIRRAMYLTRPYRDLVPKAEVESLVDYAMARAIRKYVPCLGSFANFATTFVDRIVRRAVLKEIDWYSKISGYEFAEPIDHTQLAESDVLRRELQAVLGSDYGTYISHVAWRRSIREISRMEGRSIRAVRASLATCDRKLLLHYNFAGPEMRRARGQGRETRDCSAASTFDGKSAETSPPSVATSLTNEDET